jgi:hypothetical protein
MKKELSLSIIAFLVFAGGFHVVQNNNESCVNFYVDFGSLDNSTKVEKCIKASGPTNALELVKQAGFEVEGTQKYGDAVVCRVNNLPSKSVESCDVMPPENAFWAVIVKKNQLVPFLNDWGWAQKGINETIVLPGDSLGLVFSTNGDLRWP